MPKSLAGLCGDCMVTIIEATFIAQFGTPLVN